MISKLLINCRTINNTQYVINNNFYLGWTFNVKITPVDRQKN